MVETRRSTRQSTAAIPDYTEKKSSSADERKSKKTTRQKRAREDDDGVEEDEHSPPVKKVAKAKPRPTKPKTSNSGAVQPPAPVSDTNRNANNEQEVYWLLKAEPLPRFENGVNVAFSIDDLAACTVPEPWSGVRNPQARNNMQAMRKGDLGFFYHSNAKPSGAVGILRVAEEAKVDETAFDPKDAYYDPKSDRENPKWYCVGVEYVEKFGGVVDLARLKSFAKDGGPLAKMQLVTNSRLSVCRVSKDEWDFVLGLAGEKESAHREEEGNNSEEQK
ncbi:DUF55-domain-containing protein [Dothidotthia symphoricarpi CBS 119687]|uniref:Thymocyte nuclear protein 1 n=1 Tax=Dothidotthia symphoricarpi CBS 119687 TaxID=1392245 RepID=A0A6A6A2Y2_9PLEO|nr:DUF55-domain-containing protein [Dothidotthia symphoricarpi CBS 119687]KAF2126229.1 DUF55-domain-containing protein [Dothidotthia symphoricarpi CBS 119687]